MLIIIAAGLTFVLCLAQIKIVNGISTASVHLKSAAFHFPAHINNQLGCPAVSVGGLTSAKCIGSMEKLPREKKKKNRKKKKKNLSCWKQAKAALKTSWELWQS